MKNKISCFIFLISIIFTLNSKIYGLTCEYSNNFLTATYDINESSGTVGKATVNGTLVSTDETKIKNEKQGIENWDKIFKPAKINSKGRDYYNKYNECPPYAVFVDRTGQFDFAVTTESHLDEFKKYGEKKQGYAVMKLVAQTASSGGSGSTVHDSSSGDVHGGTGANSGETSCLSYKKESTCTESLKFACVWNEKYNYCNTDKLLYVWCGNALDIPSQAPELISFAVNLLKIATPIVLILVSIITLVKALASSKEDEIKKAQSSLVKKLIAAALVFFIVSIVQFVILKVADDGESDEISTCLSCFLNNDCEKNTYYKTNVSGTYICTPIEGTAPDVCLGNK